MLSQTRKNFLKMLLINGLSKEETMEVNKLIPTEEKIKETTKNLERLVNKREGITREDVLLALIRPQ